MQTAAPETRTVRTEPSFTPSDLSWTAVATRDRRWDGRFVYAVKTTGVYCRPSCPSRRPRRENVTFFSAAVDAEAAGFRSCRRCHPRSEANGVGVTIHYATARTRLGLVLVAATQRGICGVTLGDDDAQLERGLMEEYPKADLERVTWKRAGAAGSRLGQWLDAVVRFLNGEQSALGLPLDTGGTPFERRVWKALREIPYGETRSYSEVALEIGAPQSVRAVASACARNRVALVIPCHRVVRKGGALGGYRWGLDRKRALLAQEART